MYRMFNFSNSLIIIYCNVNSLAKYKAKFFILKCPLEKYKIFNRFFSFKIYNLVNIILYFLFFGRLNPK